MRRGRGGGSPGDTEHTGSFFKIDLREREREKERGKYEFVVPLIDAFIG